MAVVVQKMVKVESAGVLFTCHPSTSDPSQMVITSTFGLGEVTIQKSNLLIWFYDFEFVSKTVVSGKCDPDTFILQRSWNKQISIQQKMLGSKNNVLKMTDDGLMESSHTEYADISSLTDKQIIELGNVGTFLEEAFGNHRDIEWGFYKVSRSRIIQILTKLSLNYLINSFYHFRNSSTSSSRDRLRPWTLGLTLN